MAPVILQSTDFPPLTSVASVPEKRTPLVAGAWTNTSPTRSILMPSPGHSNSVGNALVQHPNNLSVNNTRPEELDRGFERPAPKSNSELFNPKVTRRLPNSKTPQDKPEKDRDKSRGSMTVNTVFVSEVSTLSLEDQGGPGLSQDSFALVVHP